MTRQHHCIISPSHLPYCLSYWLLSFGYIHKPFFFFSSKFSHACDSFQTHLSYVKYLTFEHILMTHVHVVPPYITHVNGEEGITDNNHHHQTLSFMRFLLWYFEIQKAYAVWVLTLSPSQYVIRTLLFIYLLDFIETWIW